VVAASHGISGWVWSSLKDPSSTNDPFSQGKQKGPTAHLLGLFPAINKKKVQKTKNSKRNEEKNSLPSKHKKIVMPTFILQKEDFFSIIHGKNYKNIEHKKARSKK
jgi:hypothetical protein